MRALALVALFAMAVFASPVIVVHKQVSETNVLVGTEVVVTTTAINIGDTAAIDFVLQDGEIKKEATLEPQANVTIVTTIPAPQLGNLQLAAATATWTGEDRTTAFRATSNEVREEERDEKRHAMELGPRGFVNVITGSEYERLNSRYIKETILYILFVAVVVGFPFGVYRQKQVQVDFHLKESRKKKE